MGVHQMTNTAHFFPSGALFPSQPALKCTLWRQEGCSEGIDAPYITFPPVMSSEGKEVVNTSRRRWNFDSVKTESCPDRYNSMSLKWITFLWTQFRLCSWFSIPYYLSGWGIIFQPSAGCEVKDLNFVAWPCVDIKLSIPHAIFL